MSATAAAIATVEQRTATVGHAARSGKGPQEGKLDDRLLRIRHSAAHVLATAVQEYFGQAEVQLGTGPATADGFYYDFKLPRPADEDDLVALEALMRKIIAQDYPFVCEPVEPDEARTMFRDEPFKLELIDGIVAGALTADADAPAGQRGSGLTIYRSGPFVDLCQGPHVASTGMIPTDGLKLLSVAGAYWRGSEKRPMLQRIYGAAFTSAAELQTYVDNRQAALDRDHRRLGPALELFFFHETAPAMPYWLPRGVTLLNALVDFSRETNGAQGYQEVCTPLINSMTLWEQSGHWEHYHDNMFIIPIDEHRTLAAKPMNCPNAMIVFNSKTRSYRDLPLKLSDYDVLHRNERSGTLHGLFRTQRFMQDDAHVFVAEDDIAAEVDNIFALADQLYGAFGLTYSLRLGTRPEGYLGDIESWDRAEAALHEILQRRTGGDFTVEDGGGAFYGPKIDILLHDALGRTWQLGTVQLDFQLPRRFGCVYVDETGQRRTPVVLHRAIYGSLERFLGILIEHTAGAFPLWASPVQLALIPVATDADDYARDLMQQCARAGIRTTLRASDDTLNARIRRAEQEKTPVIAILGKRESEAGTVSLRIRGGRQVKALSREDLVTGIIEATRTRAADLAELFPPAG